MIETLPGLALERELWQRDIRLVAGVDEAGRGALAGPVMVGVVILPDRSDLEWSLGGVRDSKQMTPHQRTVWAAKIKEIALAWSVGAAQADEIDALGILPATRLGVTRALQSLPFQPDFLLMDYLPCPGLTVPHRMMPKGESHSLSIACASVLAKTERDSVMQLLDGQYPGYGLARHKGYGTALHRAAIRALGYSPIHRRTFVFSEDR
ncbi:MAG: ribonuclease HII [Anaerolineales bacterium]|nr:ribonuclease HII [Anaerolineales bacterium]MDW8278126.1 ribonuclease HII [Anaerolineales bacterium]